jgi:hypothetical protein
MKKIVEREKNKGYYRILHLPIWLWVFFILPGHLTYALYVNGPDRRHWVWLMLVFVTCIWRGIAGRLPGVELRPYVTHYGLDQPNVPYRVICYTAAWIDLLVPFALNLIGLIAAVLTGRWLMAAMYTYLYYPLALAVVCGTLLDWTPRARRSTVHEGVEKAWFYVAIWTVVPAQVAAWAAWRLGGRLNIIQPELNLLRLTVFVLVGAVLLWRGICGKLPRTQRVSG